MVAQQVAREIGAELRVIRARQPPPDAIRDPDVIRPAVEAWRAGVSERLREHLESDLDRDETADAPYFTDKPAWDCYSDLLLWAAYSEHPELNRPIQSVPDFGKDPAYRASTSKEFRSGYFHLLEVEWWLPCDFAFIFQTEKVAGGPVTIGSSNALARQLTELNARTWQAASEELTRWKRLGSEHGAPLESGARFAFALLLELSQRSVEFRLPMLLDY